QLEILKELDEPALDAGRTAERQPGPAATANGPKEETIALVLQVQSGRALLADHKAAQINPDRLDAQLRPAQDIARQGVKEAVEGAVIVGIAGRLIGNARQVEP